MQKHHIALLLLATGLMAQQPRAGRPKPAPLILSNDKIELSISTNGGSFNKLLLREAEQISPLAMMGHFLALDGFGAPSDEELKAGMSFHGEVGRMPLKIVAREESGPVRSVTLQGFLPLAQETLTRKFELVDGENVVYVTSDVESALAIDRPISWAEHATLGPPFLESGKTQIDMPATKCRVREEKSGSSGRIAFLKDFDWPMAPLTGGGSLNLASIPAGEVFQDLASCLIDPARTYGYVTALRADKQLLFGYVFRREDYPWMMNWMNYTGDNRAARGTEFSTQPFDVSHRETVDEHEMFGTPTYKWLPAKSRIQSKFLFFYTKVPSGFAEVIDVMLEDGQLKIKDQSRRIVTLKAQRGL